MKIIFFFKKFIKYILAIKKIIEMNVRLVKVKVKCSNRNNLLNMIKMLRLINKNSFIFFFINLKKM